MYILKSMKKKKEVSLLLKGLVESLLFHSDGMQRNGQTELHLRFCEIVLVLSQSLLEDASLSVSATDGGWNE